MGWDRSEPSILAHPNRVRVFLRDHKLYIIEFEMERIDGFLNQVPIAVANVLKLGRGNPHKKHPAGDVAEARRLEPGIKRLPVNFLFESTQDPSPRIGHGGRGGGGDKRHLLPSFNADCLMLSAKCKEASPQRKVRACHCSSCA